MLHHLTHGWLLHESIRRGIVLSFSDILVRCNIGELLCNRAQLEQPNPKGDDTQVVDALTGLASKVSGRCDCKHCSLVRVFFTGFERRRRIGIGSVCCSCAVFLSVTSVIHDFFAM